MYTMSPRRASRRGPEGATMHAGRWTLLVAPAVALGLAGGSPGSAAASESSPAIASGTPNPAPNPALSLVDLGTLGGKNTYVTAINERGQVVGGSETRDG